MYCRGSDLLLLLLVSESLASNLPTFAIISTSLASNATNLKLCSQRSASKLSMRASSSARLHRAALGALCAHRGLELLQWSLRHPACLRAITEANSDHRQRNDCHPRDAPRDFHQSLIRR